MEGLKETDGTWSLRWIRASNTVRLLSSGMSAANLKRWLKEKKTQNNNGVRATADARWASTRRHQQGHKCVLFSSSVSRLNTLVTTRVTFSLADLLWLKSKFLQKPSRERRALITRLNFQFSHRYAHKHCHTNVLNTKYGCDRALSSRAEGNRRPLRDIRERWLSPSSRFSARDGPWLTDVHIAFLSVT